MGVFSKREKIMVIVIAILLAINVYQYLTYNVSEVKNSGEIVTIEKQEDIGEIVNNNNKIYSSNETNVQTTQSKCVVYICGNVKNPGVYELSSDSRINDALILAGGALPGSDLSSVNLAEKVFDGQKIYIPKTGEVQPQNSLSALGNSEKQGAISPGSKKVNINTATKDELKTLDRIGDKLAERIIEYRQKHGPFKSIEEIKNVNGIGDKIFESIKDAITVQ